MSELTQLDELIESDILEALGEEPSQTSEIEESTQLDNIEEPLQTKEVEEILIEDLDDEQNETIQDNDDSEEQKIEETISSDHIASLLGQLLKNKTLEITIKIKD